VGKLAGKDVPMMEGRLQFVSLAGPRERLEKSEGQYKKSGVLNVPRGELEQHEEAEDSSVHSKGLTGLG